MIAECDARTNRWSEAAKGFASVAEKLPLHMAAEGAFSPDGSRIAFVSSRGDHAFAFVRRLAGRLFDIDVFAGLARPYGRECVPMVRSHNGYGVNVIICKYFLHLPFCSRLDASLFHHYARARVEKSFVGITQCFYSHIVTVLQFAVSINVYAALVAYPYDGDIDAIIGTNHRRVGLCIQSDSDSCAIW